MSAAQGQFPKSFFESAVRGTHGLLSYFYIALLHRKNKTGYTLQDTSMTWFFSHMDVQAAAEDFKNAENAGFPAKYL